MSGYPLIYTMQENKLSTSDSSATVEILQNKIKALEEDKSRSTFLIASLITQLDSPQRYFWLETLKKSKKFAEGAARIMRTISEKIIGYKSLSDGLQLVT